jgi:hypothetical protein
MIRKSGNRFSEKIMLNQKAWIMMRLPHDPGAHPGKRPWRVGPVILYMDANAGKTA